VFVLVDSFEIYQARSVLVEWAVRVGAGAAVSSVPAQTNGPFNSNSKTRAQKASTHESTHERREAEQHEAQAAQSTKA